MKTINLLTGNGLRTLIFPDNQPHVNIPSLQTGEEVRLICSITDTVLLLQMLEVANAIDHAGAVKKELIISYLMGARYDRLINPGDSVDLEVIASLINSMCFEKVYILDVHSETALQLICNSVNIPNRKLVESYHMDNALLICPDYGARRKTGGYFQWNNNLEDIVYCRKSRDTQSGVITLSVEEPEKCRERNCVIIDDLCDGGGTFLAIAAQIQPQHLTLIVTHGIFSKGFTKLEKYFDKIIVSDSYRGNYDSPIVELIKIDYEIIKLWCTVEPQSTFKGL